MELLGFRMGTWWIVVTESGSKIDLASFQFAMSVVMSGISVDYQLPVCSTEPEKDVTVRMLRKSENTVCVLRRRVS